MLAVNPADGSLHIAANLTREIVHARRVGTDDWVIGDAGSSLSRLDLVFDVRGVGAMIVSDEDGGISYWRSETCDL